MKTDTSRLIVAMARSFCRWRESEEVLPRADDDSNIGIRFHVQVECHNHGFEKDGNTYHKEWGKHYLKYVSIIVTRYGRVFVAVSDNMDVGVVAPELYENTSNHDSCWPSGIEDPINKEFWSAYAHCWDHVPEEHQKLPALADIEGRLTNIFRRQPFDYVRVKHELLDDGEHYFRKLTEITPVKFKVVLEEPVQGELK